MPDYDNPNGASLEMALPQKGRGPWWMGNHPWHDRPAGM